MRRGLRAAKIEIDLAKPDGVRWISTALQGLEIDDAGEIVSISFDDGRFHRKISDVALEFVEFDDPVTGSEGYMSVAGCGEVIKQFILAWIEEDNPSAIYDEDLDLVVLDGSD